jgi:hypothetical protein
MAAFSTHVRAPQLLKVCQVCQPWLVSKTRKFVRQYAQADFFAIFKNIFHLGGKCVWWEIMHKSKHKITHRHAHPLRVIRVLSGKLRPQFAADFGISQRYLEAIEYGEKELPDILASEISLYYGLVPESLKGKRRFPRSLIDTKEISFAVDMSGSDPGTPPLEVAVPLDEFCANVGANDKHERLSLLMRVWQKYVIRINPDRIENALSLKLGLLLRASQERYLSVAMQLSLWIDYAVKAYGLEKRIKELRAVQTGEDSEWPTFWDTLKDSFRRTSQPQSRRRQKR